MLDVSSVPGEVWPAPSWQDWMPGPLALSVQVKLVATDWPRANVCPSAGALMVADGGAATV